jgi:nicotinamide-nucleotide adenylyltransferase
MTELGCVTGRFQPVHRQHVELFEIALAHCDHLVVAITNPDAGARHADPASAHRHTSAANPFTFFERARLLGAVLGERGIADRATVVPFDLTRPQRWPEYVPLAATHFVRAYSEWERRKAGQLGDAGYAVTLLDGDPHQKLSATEVRRLLREGDARWQEHLPAATVPVLTDLLGRTPMRERG